MKAKRQAKKKIITICSSASFYKQVVDLEKELKKLGFKVLIPSTAKKMKRIGNFDVAKHKTWHKNPSDYKIKTRLMNQHFKKVLQAEAILVVNNQKKDIKGYIGANALMEMALAFHYKKPIYILNAISEDLSFKEEVLAMNPIFINSNLKLIR